MQMTLTPVTSTSVVELIILGFLELNIGKDMYGYDEETQRSTSHHLSEAMIRVPDLPLLTWLKSCDHLLSPKEILSSEVDKDLAFKDLDEAGVTCPLASLAAKATPNVPSSNI